jgi:isopentenyl diphosphate isomerase/L-lactate dehydrogenase-like FMN-dependent dehydrogenase
VLGLPIGGEEINNHHKSVKGPLDIHRSKAQMVVKHSTSSSCTYSVMVVFSNVGRPSSRWNTVRWIVWTIIVVNFQFFQYPCCNRIYWKSY